MRTLTTHATRHSRRLGGQVERYHTWPTIRRQSNGEHTWQVMRIYHELFGSRDMRSNPDAWLVMLYHDTPEAAFGDIPFSGDHPGSNWAALKKAAHAVEAEAARAMGLPDITLDHATTLRVKLCDVLECYEFGAEEELMGNKYGALICENVVPLAMRIAGELGITGAITSWLSAVRPLSREEK